MTRRLLLSYLSITALVLLLLEVPLGFALASAERDRLEADAQHDAFALALRSEEVLEGDPAKVHQQLQPLAQSYQEDFGGRVVFVDAAGKLVADSDPPTIGGTSEVEVGRDFSSRTEIRRALAGADVTGQRHSATLGTDFLYVAVPIASGGVIHGVVRVTYPLSFVSDRIRDSWLVLAAVGAIVLLVVLVVSVMLARSISRPLVALKQSADALGHGALETRVEVPKGPRELHSLGRSFNITAARLEQLLDAQQEFVADASHQLRTPLAALRLRLENLASEITPDGLDDLDGAVEEVARLSLLVDGLLELARVEQHGSQPEPIEVRAVVEARGDAWSAFAEERGVTIDVAVSDEVVLATPGRLEQVLDNLLNNALEVAPSGSTIRVSVDHGTVRDDEVVIRVSDAGPGMTDEQRARAFDRFWRAGNGSGAGGFGLGLAIVRQLVVADGGTVTLGTSTAGGLEVLVALPADR